VYVRFTVFMLFVDVVVFVSRIHVRVKYNRSNCLFTAVIHTRYSLNHKTIRCSQRVHAKGENSPKKYWAGRALVVNLGGWL